VTKVNTPHIISVFTLIISKYKINTFGHRPNANIFGRRCEDLNFKTILFFRGWKPLPQEYDEYVGVASSHELKKGPVLC
jgi:hypothetical protein